MQHYVDISRLKEKYAKVFTLGEKVVIQTKIDGSNASFTYNPVTDKVDAFSRKTKLNESNALRGFYAYAKTFSPEAIKAITDNGRYIIFGEWLCSHKVKYPESMYNKFYMFDVYDTEIEQYLPFEATYQVYNELFLLSRAFNIADKTKFVPVVYEGKFRGWEKTMELLKVSTTKAEPCEEGIVIKSQDRLDNKFSGTPAYLKIVNEQFAEVKAAKTKKILSPEELAAANLEREKVESIVTYRRVEKFLDKLIDEGILPVDYDEHQLGIIMKNLPRLIYADCQKEEPEIVEECPHFGKFCGEVVRRHVFEKINKI